MGHMNTLMYLRSAYLTAVAELVARHPGQAANVPYYTAWAAGARLGVLRRDVRTKLSFTAKGTHVLFTPDQTMPGRVQFWAIRPDGSETKTVVKAGFISEISEPEPEPETCGGCGGSGFRRYHPSALVAMRCHECR